MTTKTDVVAEARSWIGVPWRHQGRTREGIDCAGLVAVVARALGLSNYDTVAYQRRPFGFSFAQHFRDGGGKEMSVLTAGPGDIMVFRDGSYPCHCGIVSVKRGAQHIIHAHAGKRKVWEDPIVQDGWDKKAVTCFKFPGLVE